MRTRRWAAVALAAALVVVAPPTEAAERSVARAICARGDLPETALQGQVPLRDRESGRSLRGYRCHLELLGQHQGVGSSWVSASYGRCAYLPQTFPTAGGVRVVDVSDPRRPRATATLRSPAFATGAWESLKANDRRGLLAGTSGTVIEGAAFFDVYDVRTDCRGPRLMSRVPSTDLGLPGNALGHEGAWSPDGRTYWASGGVPGLVTAIDVSDPALPRVAWTGLLGTISHGLSLSPDGRTMYLATINPQGLAVVDVSAVQDRRTPAQPTVLSRLTWTDGGNGQHAVPVTWNGRRHVVFVDEMKHGAVRLIDVHDPRRPRIVNRLRLEVHTAQNAAQVAADTPSAAQFGYEAHYCAVDRPTDPTRLACGMFASGVRVFDVRDPLRVREIAYYNPPAQVARRAELLGSEHAHGVATGDPTSDLRTDWCTSPPRFVGRDQLWVACQDSGFLVLRFR